MATATVLVLFRQLGENATTPHDPCKVVSSIEGTTAVLADGSSVDLTEITHCCANSDDNRLVAKPMFSIYGVTLPEWMTADEWLRNTSHWKWAWGTGVDINWPEAIQRKLANLATAERMAACKLLATKTFRSSFRQSLRNQLDAWLNGESNYPNPFSPKQWDCLIRSPWEAKQRDSSLYHAKGCYSTQLTPIELAA